MILSIIAAIGKNGELGKDNKLLWNLPADMKHFREMTSGHAIIMGRKTYESIGRPLPNRRNIVITRDNSYMLDGVLVVHSLEEAINLFSDSGEEVFIIGGALIYNLSFNIADKIYITEIGKEFDADVFLPKINLDVWREISREEHDSDDKNLIPYSFITYLRKSA